MAPGPTLESQAQRRRAVRYKLRLPVIFHWNEDFERTGAGFTSDIALDGALILSSECPPLGSHVRLAILIPPPDHSQEELLIECEGKVTRVLGQNGASGFGVYGIFDDDHLTRHVLK